MTASNLDPRSPEFVDMLQKLSTAIAFLSDHPDILDAEKYRLWLDKLQTRAVSLVGRAMRDLLDGAGKKCRDIIQQKLYAKAQEKGADDQPLESTPLYQKFRGLSYRMKELSHVLFEGGLSKRDLGTNSQDDSSPRYHHHSKQQRLYEMRHSAKATLTEVKRAYAVLRMELLVPFVKDAWLAALAQARTPLHTAGGHQSLMHAGSGTNLASIVEHRDSKRVPAAPVGANDKHHLSLSVALRQVFAILVRVAQLEHQLFESLFALEAQQKVSTPSSGGPLASSSLSRVPSFRQPNPSLSSSSSSSHGHVSSHMSESDLNELAQIVEAAGNVTRDFLRPLIIKESSVDELCRVVSVLSEDMRAQLSVLPVPPTVLRLLLINLDTTVNDAKERLTYCAETKLRQEVQLFEPLPSHLAYPDILEALEEKKKSILTNGGDDGGHAASTSTATLSPQEIYQTWFPPMRQTLSLLSKLYGVVAPPVFEDFARRSIEACVRTLRSGADGVKRTHPVIHGDLFLVRHLLILREQLAPFDIKLQSIEKQLDFASTGLAIQELWVHQARNLWRFDQQNGFLQFAKQGLPTMQELHTDAKKELDEALRKSCLSFKLSAVKMLLGPLDAFLAKVAAFLGDIPYQSLANNNNGNNQRPSVVNGNQPVTPTADGTEDGAAATQRPSSLATRTPVLTTEQKNLLKNQSFVRPERLKECLEQVQHLITQRMPDIKDLVKVRSLPSLPFYVSG